MEKADEFVIENGILKKYSGSGQHVSVPEGTEIIGPGAFRGCGRIKTVSFPGSVKKIGEMAFYDCRRLAGVRLPEDLEEIGDRAFQFCRDLASVRIPGKVKRIGAHAFAGCGKLESLSMDRVPEKIGESAFTACPLLADPDGFVIIGGILFDYAGESPYVHIPHSVWKIGENAFWGPPAVREVFLPEGLACIGSGAFRDCEDLKTIRIPESVRDLAFRRSAFLRAFRKSETMPFTGVAPLKARPFPRG